MASREPSSAIYALNRNILSPEKFNPDLIRGSLTIQHATIFLSRLRPIGRLQVSKDLIFVVKDPVLVDQDRH